MNSKLLVLVVILATCCCSDLPSHFKKCDRKRNDFNECIKVAVQDALAKGTVPAKEIGFPTVDPLEIRALVIGAGSGPVAFQQNYKDMKLIGFKDFKCDKVELDFDKKTFYMDCTTPLLTMSFNYEINGKILLLPIYGKGPGSIAIGGCNLKLSFSLEEYDKRGAKYFKISSHKLDLTPNSMKFDLDNLFDGDKALGDNIIQVMNDNWKDVFTDVKSSYEDAFGQIFSSVFGVVLGKVPISKLFGQD